MAQDLNRAPRAAQAPPDAARRKVRRQLLMVALIGIAPVVASYAAYYWWPRDSRVNYGALVAAPAPAIEGATLDARPFSLVDLRGKWVMLAASGGACDAACATRLYAGRQARTIQNADMDRIVRVWLVTDDAAPPSALLAEHPDLRVVRVAPARAGALPRHGAGLLLIDPLGNVVLDWPADPDVKAVARDVSRLLRASGIG
jgi:hypothetical protein